MAKEPNDIGKEIEEEIRKTVSTVGTELSRGLSTAAQQIGQSIRDSVANMNTPSTPQPAYKQQNKNTYNYSYHYSYPKTKNKKVQVQGRAGNILMGIFGAVFGLSLLNIATTLFDKMYLSTGDSFAASLVFALILLSFAVISGVFSYVGFSGAARAKRLSMYLTFIGDKKSCTVKAIAAATHTDILRVRKDFKKMIKQGLLRDGLYDEKTDTVYMDAGVYQQQMEEEDKKQQAEPPAQPAPQPKKAPADEILAQGNAFLVRLTQLESSIEEQDVLAQTQELRARTQRILNWLQKHPSCHMQVRRFSTYYLPTVEKLLTTYNEVDAQADHSSVASDIQSNIVEVLHSVNTAFENLEDNLLQDTAMDISSEISALETMLAQDGLHDDELSMHIQ